MKSLETARAYARLLGLEDEVLARSRYIAGGDHEA